MTRKSNVLDAKRQHQFNTWADQNREKFRGKTQPQIAIMASDDLGYKITPKNVSSVIRILDINTSAKPVQPELFDNEELKQLTKRIVVLEDDMLKLEATLAGLLNLKAEVNAFAKSVAENVQNLTKRVNDNEILVEQTAARVLRRSN